MFFHRSIEAALTIKLSAGQATTHTTDKKIVVQFIF
jgi:hypothetical protein